MNPDTPVPPDQRLACALWKCHRIATQGPGDGSVTWWTLQPIERARWIDTAIRVRQVYEIRERWTMPSGRL